MKALTAGHLYEVLNVVDIKKNQTIQFIDKKPKDGSSTELTLVSDGTTTEEVLQVLINRMEFLQKTMPCRENALVITKLEEADLWLKKRTCDRIKRAVEGTHQA